MMYFKYNKILVVSLLLTTIFSLSSYSQYKDDYYYNLGFSTGSDLIKSENENNSVGYKFRDVNTFNIGLNYKITREKYFTVFSLETRIYNLKNDVLIKKEDFNSKYDLIDYQVLTGFAQFKLKAILNRRFMISKNINFYLGTGPEILLYEYDPISGSILADVNSIEVGYTEKGQSKKNGIYLGINFNVGFEVKTKYLIISPYILYHYQSTNLFENIVTTQNLLVSPNTVSQHNIKGEYISFGFIFYPKTFKL